MSQHLRSCIRCARHIRITETTCPFCKAGVPTERMSPPPRGTPATRLGRAIALSTIAATGVGGSAAACSSSSSPQVITGADAYGTAPSDGGPHHDAGADVLRAADVLTAADAYGTAAPRPDTGADVLTAADAYGRAPEPDTGADVLTAADAYGRAPEPDTGPM